MRVIGSQQHPDCVITFFHWNNRYLIKIESGPFEQTFKIQEFDLASEDELSKIVTPEFINDCLDRFTGMDGSLRRSIERL